jgi:hypothetical protein
MVGALLGIVLSGAQIQKPIGNCSIYRLDECKSENYLYWSPSFRYQLRRFFSYAPNYLHVRPYWYAMLVLGEPLDDPVRLDDGSWLFAGCQEHECGERAVAGITASGRVAAVGFLDFHCERTMQGRCDPGGLWLDIFVKPDDEQATAVFVPAIESWASAQMTQENSGPDKLVYRGAKVIILPRARPRGPISKLASPTPATPAGPTSR